MKRRLLVLATMMLSVAMLSLAQDKDQYSKCISKCHAEGAYIYNTCMIVHNDTTRCNGQANDYESGCCAGCAR